MKEETGNLVIDQKIVDLYRQIDTIINSKEEIKKSRYEGKLNISAKAQKVLEDIDDNHNYSLAMGIIRKNRKNLNRNALSYRGTKISYGKLFEMVYTYANSLKNTGFKKGMQVPVFGENTPEFIALYLAANLIGCKLLSMGEWFDKDYTEFLLNKSGSKYVFVSDSVYDVVKDKLDDSKVANVVLMNLGSSLPKDKSGKNYNPYAQIDDRFNHDFSDKSERIKTESKKEVLKIEEFLDDSMSDDIVSNMSLDDPAMISFTSGTTSPGVPKAVLHANRSYLTLSRFKDKDISGLASMDGKSVLCHIPVYTHMELATISDALYQGCELCLEPFYDRKFFKYSIVMYKPNYSPGSEGSYLDLCKNLNDNPEFKNVTLKDFVAMCITGEGLTPGSEKYINYTARKHKFGTHAVPRPISPITASIGGGTSENSGVFTTLFKSLREKFSFRNEPFGLIVLPFAEVAVLDDEGHYCKAGKVGNLVVESPCNMIGYLYTEEDFPRLHVKEKKKLRTSDDGRVWGDANTIAALSKYSSREVMMKGRNEYLQTEYFKIPLYKIDELVRKDTKNILTANTVEINDDVIGKNYVIHVEFSPLSHKSKHEILKGIVYRIAKSYPECILEKLYIRVRSYGESFPVAPSGKRDLNALREEGYTDKCMSVINLYNNYKNQNKKKNKKEARVLELTTVKKSK